MSATAYVRILKVSRIIAYLEGSGEIRLADVAKADDSHSRESHLLDLSEPTKVLMRLGKFNIF
ncbi:MAG: hypothetical protein M3R67_12775 [Acidobacteriota bacterium]|nr:hypothetical protein [Acidobacteriota bacterium]